MANGNGPLIPGPPWPHITAIAPGWPKRLPGESDAVYDQRLNAWFKLHGAPDSHGGDLFPPINPPSTVAGIPNPIAHISSVADFIQALGNANTWVRVGEVVVGIVLVAAGVSAMLHVSPTKVAKAAAIA